MKQSLLYLSALALCSAPLAWADPQPDTPASAATVQAAYHPYFEDVLYPSWATMTAEQAAIDVRAAIALAKQRQAAIREVKPEEANYDNVFAAFESMDTELERAETFMHHLASVMDNPELRSVMESLIPEVSAYSSAIIADEQLWHVIKTASTRPWVKQLSPARQRYVQQVVDSFHDSGADLSKEQKDRLAKIAQELSLLTHSFNKHVLDSTNAWQWAVEDPALLDGMSKDWLARAAADAKQKGLGSDEKPIWLITLDEPSAREVLYSCAVESTRKKCWEAMRAVGKGGEFDTADIIARVMELRHEMATLLGFDTYADMALAHRMAGSGKKAMAFVDDMMQKVKPAFDDEINQLRDYIASCKGCEPTELLNPWDIAYYMRKLSKERFNFDPELLRPYHEYSRVLRGMFGIYQHLYNISIREHPTFCPQEGEPTPEGAVQVWHPEVRLFSLHDNRTGAHLGSFYLDIFPRASKRAGAWVLPLSYGAPAADGKPHSPHLAALVGNLSPATEEKPALFSHTDVETLFHEFGHMLHVMMGDTELRAHNGTSVAWDFVELPSQINENWTWEPLGIATYAVHYKTGEHLPNDVIQKMLRSRFFFPAQENMGQLCLAKLDLEMHTNYNEKFKGRDLDEASHELLAPWRAPMSVQAPSIMRSLTHCISGGYAAGYYSYKWAEVLAADVFTRFQKDGVLNPAIGNAFREAILSKGDSKPAAELYRDFMGRDPNPDALLQKQGLLK